MQRTFKYKPKKVSWKKDFKLNWGVYLLFLPTFVLFFVLNYLPMFGIVMAFEDYSVLDGVFGSKWVWFDNFVKLFSGEEFLNALKNTVILALMKITIGFIAPIVFAVLLSLLRSKRYKRTVQTMSYMPNFVAAVVVTMLLRQFVAEGGPLTKLLTDVFGAEDQNWLANNKEPVFWLIYTFMGIWQGVGWGSIMYVAAISAVNGDLYEAAAIDGATRMQRLFKITLPSIFPLIVMMFVMNVGLCFTQGFDNILLLYMPATYNVSDTIYTYTYRIAGFAGGVPDYGLSAASGLFQSIVGTILLVGSNAVSKKVAGSSLF